MRAMLVQLAVCLAVAGAAPFVDGPAILAVLGLAQSAGTLAGAGFLLVALFRKIGGGTESFARPLLRTIAVSVLMALPAYAVARLIAGHVAAASAEFWPSPRPRSWAQASTSECSGHYGHRN
jgi:hypothetical protein